VPAQRLTLRLAWQLAEEEAQGVPARAVVMMPVAQPAAADAAHNATHPDEAPPAYMVVVREECLAAAPGKEGASASTMCTCTRPCPESQLAHGTARPDIDGAASAMTYTDPSLIHRVGSDASFLLSLMSTMLFSWVALLLCMCCFSSVASRTGSLAGMGFHLIWVAVYVLRANTLSVLEGSIWASGDEGLDSSQAALPLTDRQRGVMSCMLVIGVILVVFPLSLFLRFRRLRQQVVRDVLVSA
jgi:hypothetical protein